MSLHMHTLRRRSGFGRLGGLCTQELLPEDRHVARGFNSQADLVAVDIDHGDADVVGDVNFLTEFPGKNEHCRILQKVK